MPTNGQNVGLRGIERIYHFLEISNRPDRPLIDFLDDIAFLQLTACGIVLCHDDAVNVIRQIELLDQRRCQFAHFHGT